MPLCIAGKAIHKMFASIMRWTAILTMKSLHRPFRQSCGGIVKAEHQEEKKRCSLTSKKQLLPKNPIGSLKEQINQ